MSNNKETPKTTFKAITPDGHTYQVFEDGTTEGFPHGTIVFNNWLPILNKEKALSIKPNYQPLVIRGIPLNSQTQMGFYGTIPQVSKQQHHNAKVIFEESRLNNP